jgi:glutamate dehydrogenase/leucine dehydrogenase
LTNGKKLEIIKKGFMNELLRHIGSHRAIPTGDIGVGVREIVLFLASIKKLVIDTGILNGEGIN